MTISSSTGVTQAEFLYTKEDKVWNQRDWQSMPASISGSKITATLPKGTVAFYFNATDERGLMSSSAYLLVEW